MFFLDQIALLVFCVDCFSYFSDSVFRLVFRLIVSKISVALKDLYA
jgi:hypothetical protein